MSERFDEEGFVAGSFDQVKIYDAPMVALSQIFDGEASFRSLRDTFLDPAALSPAERDSFTSRLKMSLGNNPFTNSLVDVALNPFVWMLFVTSPAAGNALKSGGKVFTGLTKKAVDETGTEYRRFITGNYSFLQTLGLLNAHQYGAGTPLTSILTSFSQRFSKLTRDDTLNIAPSLGRAMDNVGKKFGVRLKSLDPYDAPNATAIVDGESISLRDYLKKFNVYAHVHMAGMDKDITRKVATLGENFKLKFHIDGKHYSYEVSRKQKERIDELKSNIANQKKKIQEKIRLGEDTTGLEISMVENAQERNSIIRTAMGYEGPRTGPRGEIFAPLPTGGKGAPKEITTTPILSGKLAYEEGMPLRVNTFKKEVKAVDPDQLSTKWLEKEGFMPLLSHSREMMKDRYADMFLDTAAWSAGKVKYDDTKLLRIFKSLSQDAGTRSAVEVSMVLDKELQGHVGRDAYKKIMEALIPSGPGKPPKLQLSEFTRLLKKVREKSDDLNNYMPRNVWTYAEATPNGIRKNRTDSIRRSAADRRTSRLTGRVNERRLDDPFIDSDDLQILFNDYERKGLRNSKLNEMIRTSRSFENGAEAAEHGRVQVMNLDWGTSFNRYLKSTRSDVVLHIDDASIDPYILRAAVKDPQFEQLRKEVAKSPKKQKEWEAFGPAGSRSRYEYLKLVTDHMATSLDTVGRSGGARAQEYVMGTLLERMRGNLPMNDLISEWVSLKTIDMADSMANSRAFQKIKGMGGYAEKFVKKLEEVGGMSLDDARGSSLGRGLTTALYASHLGFNLGSAVLNLMQPLMFAASWMDADVMIKAYGRAFKQYFGYINDRRKLPLNADALEIDNLRAKHFRLSNVATKDRPQGTDLLDIRKTDFELLDSQAFASESILKRKTPFQFWASEMPMKLFTHTEIFNRTVTGEAMLGQMMKTGKLKSLDFDGAVHRVRGGGEFADVETVENVRDMVQNTQFGSDLINSPRVFQTSFLGIPWVRQFFTFPIRTLTSWFDTSPMVNQGRRTWGLTGFQTEGRFPTMMHDMMRMMGTSAVVYELGKNLAGADLSRGLAGQTMYESTIVGPFFMEPASEAAYNIPMSPALDIINDGIKAMSSDDQSILGTLAPRLMPGGIAFSRLLNAAPQISKPSGWLGGMQREYADWGQMQGGQVPIYRQDGSLLEYRSAARTVLGGIGFNSYMFKNDKELNSFLIKNRQGIVDERRKYLDAVLANNMDKAAKIKANFEKRFKFPLSVSKDQVDRAIQLREVPLKERMYQRLTPDFRPIVRPYLAERLETLKARTPEELDLSTAQKARVLPSTFETYDPYSAVTE